jgi:Uma2 family endonuclease
VVQELSLDRSNSIIYPDSDGQPMSDNTKQFQWIVTIKENLETLFADHAQVFVAGDLLWYPVEGEPKIRQAPDVMVVFGRAKGHRGFYQQWREDNIPPQVVFEILSPGNRLGEMAKKFQFYQRYGVEEYYIYDPDHNDLSGWVDTSGDLEVIEDLNGWISPRLAIRFELTPDTLIIYRPDGQKFLTFLETAQQREFEKQRADLAIQALDLEKQRYQDLLARLKVQGIEVE